MTSALSSQLLELPDLPLGFTGNRRNAGCGIMKHQADLAQPAADRIDQPVSRVPLGVRLRRWNVLQQGNALPRWIG
jgi:hypothetical protein